MMKRSKMFGELSHFLNFALSESPPYFMLDMRKRSVLYKV